MRHIGGESAFPRIQTKYACPFAEYAWRTRTHSAAWKDIAGNAMQLQVLTAVIAYLLSHVVPLSQAPQLSFHRGFTSDCDLDDDQGQELQDTPRASASSTVSEAEHVVALVREVRVEDGGLDIHDHVAAAEPVVTEPVASEAPLSAPMNSGASGSRKKLRLA